MQTFLPYADYAKSAAVIDNSRLGNQCYRECKTLIQGKWKNHPAAKMWVGHEFHLAKYSLALAHEMGKRTRPDGSPKWKPEVVERWTEFWTVQMFLLNNTGPPAWLGSRKLHQSHRSNLLRKDPDHYRKFWPKLRDDLPYIWPV